MSDFKILATNDSSLSTSKTTNHNFFLSSEFKSLVRQAINDELFIRDILQTYNFSSKIDNELSKKIPEKIKKNINVTIPKMVESHINSYVMEKMPNFVLKEIKSQLTDYLNNNTQMQQILSSHTEYLNAHLNVVANEILNKLVNDPNYQRMTNTHLDAMDKIYLNKVDEISRNSSIQLQTIDKKCNDEIDKMKKSYTNTVSELQSSLSKVDKLNKKIDKLEIYNTVMGIFIIGVGFIFSYNFMKKVI